MRVLRRLLADRLCGGLVVAIVGYTLLFQGIVVATAHGAMANGAPAPDFVLCSQHRVAAGGDTSGRGRLPVGADRSCCNGLCQAACSVGAAIAPVAPCFEAPEPVRASVHATRAGVSNHPPSLGLTPEARAPPAILL